MDYTEKLFLVPRTQIDRLKESKVSPPIRQEVVHDLDTAIKAVLSRTDLTPHEKASQYSTLLQRYLTLVKQGEQDTSTLKLMMPNHFPREDVDGAVDQTIGPDLSSEADTVVSEVLQNISNRSKNNARYILDKLSGSGEVAKWNAHGEFISHGEVIKGSHIFDLVKRVTSLHIGQKGVEPEGWGEFIKTIADLNIPLATIPNTRVRDEVRALKQPFNAAFNYNPYVDFKTPVRPDRHSRPKRKLDWHTY